MKFKVVSDKNRRVEINWDRVNLYTSRYKPFSPFDIEIVRRKKTISDPMRKYYFGLVIKEFMKHLGYEPHEEELFHRQLKVVYFQIKPDAKGIYRNVPSVFSNESEIDVSLKKQFVDWVIRRAAHEGCYIPDPNEENEPTTEAGYKPE